MVLVQDCFRHFDVDKVGKSPVHFTLFEMDATFLFRKRRTTFISWVLLGILFGWRSFRSENIGRHVSDLLNSWIHYLLCASDIKNPMNYTYRRSLYWNCYWQWVKFWLEKKIGTFDLGSTFILLNKGNKSNCCPFVGFHRRSSWLYKNCHWKYWCAGGCPFGVDLTERFCADDHDTRNSVSTTVVTIRKHWLWSMDTLLPIIYWVADGQWVLVWLVLMLMV